MFSPRLTRGVRAQFSTGTRPRDRDGETFEHRSTCRAVPAASIKHPRWRPSPSHPLTNTFSLGNKSHFPPGPDLQVLFITSNFYPWKTHLFGQLGLKKNLQGSYSQNNFKMAVMQHRTHHIKLPVTFTTDPKHNLANTIKANICQLLG